MRISYDTNEPINRPSQSIASRSWMYVAFGVVVVVVLIAGAVWWAVTASDDSSDIPATPSGVSDNAAAGSGAGIVGAPINDGVLNGDGGNMPGDGFGLNPLATTTGMGSVGNDASIPSGHTQLPYPKKAKTFPVSQPSAQGTKDPNTTTTPGADPSQTSGTDSDELPSPDPDQPGTGTPTSTTPGGTTTSPSDPGGTSASTTPTSTPPIEPIYCTDENGRPVLLQYNETCVPRP